MKRAVFAALLAVACERGPSPSPAAATRADVPAAAPAPPPDVPPPPPANRTLSAPTQGAASDPPLRAYDPTMAVPRWQGQGTVELTLPPRDGAVTGTLRAGDLVLRVRGFRAGDAVRATLEPEAVDVDAAVSVWRGLLELTVQGDALRGAWSVSAEGGRLARAGTVGAR